MSVRTMCSAPHIGLAMDVKVFFTTIKKVLMRSDINTTTGKAATMDYFNGQIKF